MTSGELPNSVFHQRPKIDGTAPHAVTPQIEAGNVYLPEVTLAPWEPLHDGTEFIAVGAKTTVTRLPLGIVPPRDLPAIPSPLRMLALVSSPPDLPDNMRLNVEAEQELILEAVNAPAGQGKLHVDFEDEAKLAILEWVKPSEAGMAVTGFLAIVLVWNRGMSFGMLNIGDPLVPWILGAVSIAVE